LEYILIWAFSTRHYLLNWILNYISYFIINIKLINNTLLIIETKFFMARCGLTGKKRFWRNTIIYNIFNSYLSQNIQLLFHHTDSSSNVIILFKTDLSSLLCLLEIGQSTFPNYTPPISINLAWIFLNFGIFKRWLFGIYLKFKSEILKCGLTDLNRVWYRLGNRKRV